MSRQKHFHMITMDQTLSADYCKRYFSPHRSFLVPLRCLFTASICFCLMLRVHLFLFSVSETQANARAERLAQGGVADVQIGMAVLTIDSDRLETAKRRTDFFQDELMHHQVKNMRKSQCFGVVLARYSIT